MHQVHLLRDEDDLQGSDFGNPSPSCPTAHLSQVTDPKKPQSLSVSQTSGNRSSGGLKAPRPFDRRQLNLPAVPEENWSNGFRTYQNLRKRFRLTF